MIFKKHSRKGYGAFRLLHSSPCVDRVGRRVSMWFWESLSQPLPVRERKRGGQMVWLPVRGRCQARQFTWK